MADCRIKIEFDESKRAYSGGEPISGNVVVIADSDVRCKGLKVTSYWATHGRGNATRGETDVAVLFDGDWLSGKEYRYPFKLATASWPPTHYGNLINVSHFVEAQAKLPWALDPKGIAKYSVVATDAPEGASPIAKSKNSFWFTLLLAPIAIIFLFLFIPFLLLLVPLAGVIGLCYWLIKIVIPGRITGKVQFLTQPAIVLMGDSITGSCEFTPKTTSPIYGITWTIKCIEKCVSGSGTKRSSHQHDFFSRVHTLAQAGTLKSGERQRFDLEFQLPATAPASMKLTDNEIHWSSEFRIAIPKWPDWVKEIPFVVKPTKHLPNQERLIENSVNANVTSNEEKWLTEVLRQVLQSEESPGRLEEVLEAIGTQAFRVTLDLQDESEEFIPLQFAEEGIWLLAMDPLRNIKVALFVSFDKEQNALEWTRNWQGDISIVGLEPVSKRVLMKTN